MMTAATFLVPEFDKHIPNKINEKVAVTSKNTLTIKMTPGYHSAIATTGFSSKKDGVYVYAIRIDSIGGSHLMIGFTDTATYDSKKCGWIGSELPGTSLYCYSGERSPQFANYFLKAITEKAKEIISILTISNDGTKKEVQWIVDGNEGAVVDCSTEEEFGNENEIFACISLGDVGQQVTMIPFDQVEYRSSRIDQLMQEFHNNTNQNEIIVHPSLPQIKMELKCGAEVDDLKLHQMESESGQRRQRECEEEMKVKHHTA